MIRQKVETDFTESRQYCIENFEKVREVHDWIQSFSLEQFKQDNADMENIDVVKNLMEKLHQWSSDIQRYVLTQPYSTFRAMLYIDGKTLKVTLSNAVQKNYKELQKYLTKEAKLMARDVKDEYEQCNEKLLNVPTSLGDFVAHKELVVEYKAKQPALEAKKQQIEEMYNLLKKKGVQLGIKH